MVSDVDVCCLALFSLVAYLFGSDPPIYRVKHQHLIRRLHNQPLKNSPLKHMLTFGTSQSGGIQPMVIPMYRPQICRFVGWDLNPSFLCRWLYGDVLSYAGYIITVMVGDHGASKLFIGYHESS